MVRIVEKVVELARPEGQNYFEALVPHVSPDSVEISHATGKMFTMPQAMFPPICKLTTGKN